MHIIFDIAFERCKLMCGYFYFCNIKQIIDGFCRLYDSNKQLSCPNYWIVGTQIKNSALLLLAISPPTLKPPHRWSNNKYPSPECCNLMKFGHLDDCANIDQQLLVNTNKQQIPSISECCLRYITLIAMKYEKGNN